MRLTLALFAALTLLSACSDNTASSTGKEATGEAAAASAQPLSEAAAGRYLLDKTHGYVTFSYLHQGYSRPWLRFREVDATLDLDPANPSKSKLQVSIDAASIDSGVDIFDEHLRGEQFFDVARFPTIEYTSTGVKQGSQAGTYTVDGILTMKGVARALDLDARFNKSGQHFKTKKPQVGFSATAKLKRSEWDLGQYVPMVGDDVDVVIEVEFIQP